MIHIYNNQNNKIRLTLNEFNSNSNSIDYTLNIKSIQNNKEYTYTLFSSANTSSISFFNEYDFNETIEVGQYTYTVYYLTQVVETGYLEVHDSSTNIPSSSYTFSIGNNSSYDPTK